MNYEEVSVNYFFRNKEIIGNQKTAFETSQKILNIRDSINQKKPQLMWPSVFKEVEKKCPELLDIKLKDILVEAWKKYNQVEQCLKQGVENQDETFLVPLIQHSIISEHHPKIEIKVDEINLGTIDFEIKLELELEGIILKIKGSKITGVNKGSCKCKALLACEGIILFQDTSETYSFD
jgi:hypothetical protein